ncbi:MAG: hypothetical protein WCC55_02565 [Nitrosotalea sp.]
MTDNMMIDGKNRPSLDEMWHFIDNIMRPNKLVPYRSTLSYEEVFSVYSKLSDVDQMFKEFTQIEMLRKAVEEEKSITTQAK